jgi:hypothetical protein
LSLLPTISSRFVCRLTTLFDCTLADPSSMFVMIAILIRVFIHVCADCNFNQNICPYQF